MSPGYNKEPKSSTFRKQKKNSTKIDKNKDSRIIEPEELESQHMTLNQQSKIDSLTLTPANEKESKRSRTIKK